MQPKTEDKPKLLVILGPTASGKSSLAISLAKEIGNTEIINADSLQVYKYFDIGTAKPLKIEQQEVPHHLVDVVYPDEDFNAGTFRSIALNKIESLFSENKNIIVVGGTFLYARSLLYGLIDNIDIDSGLREKLNIKMQRYGLHYLYEKLKSLDPKAANKIHPNDYIRIQRALEVNISTGNSISKLQENHGFSENNFNILKLGLKSERTQLKKKIEERVDKMYENGFVDEVIKIRNMGYGSELKPMKSIGYKEINLYLNNRLDFEQAKDLIKRDSKRFAKRQLTWLRKEKDILWKDPVVNKDLYKLCKEFFS